MLMSIADMVQKMIDDLNETMADAVKSDKGNNAAMTRVRKAMQAAKGAAQDVRMQISSIRNG
jgi:hypothetical protein|tara:strand:- start:2327 stop:2512 length:186 start_codon:yes stop_codon:yes gene_type:complete